MDNGRRHECAGKLIMESVVETKAATMVQFLEGCVATVCGL
jgi:hypothetical protein